MGLGFCTYQMGQTEHDFELANLIPDLSTHVYHPLRWQSAASHRCPVLDKSKETASYCRLRQGLQPQCEILY